MTGLVDGRDDFQVRIAGAQRDESLAHATGRAVDGDMDGFGHDID
jgi:hypothetical protein